MKTHSEVARMYDRTIVGELLLSLTMAATDSIYHKTPWQTKPALLLQEHYCSSTQFMIFHLYRLSDIVIYSRGNSFQKFVSSIVVLEPLILNWLIDWYSWMKRTALWQSCTLSIVCQFPKFSYDLQYNSQCQEVKCDKVAEPQWVCNLQEHESFILKITRHRVPLKKLAEPSIQTRGVCL